MKICAIICEYNPLHNGHAEHIKKTRELTGCDALVLLMSGNFVQRGEPAMADKFIRARWGILAGADAVLELPAVYALSNAEKFAYGAVKILGAVPQITTLSFGSEHGDLDTMIRLANFLSCEPPEFKEAFAEEMKQGNSPASSKTAAALKCINSGVLQVESRDRAIETLCSPNSILGLEYLKAIINTGAKLSPVTIKRVGAGHNETSINSDFPSATAIRRSWYTCGVDEILGAIPDFVGNDLIRLQKTNSLSRERLGDMILYRIRSMSAEEIGELYDVSEGLENRIKKYADYATSYESAVDAVKTKRYSHARLRRIFMYALLSITKKCVTKTDKAPPYAKLLAVRKGREDVISALAKSKLTLLTRSDDYRSPGANDAAIATDALATDVYGLLNSDPGLRMGGRDRSSGVTFI